MIEIEMIGFRVLNVSFMIYSEMRAIIKMLGFRRRAFLHRNNMRDI